MDYETLRDEALAHVQQWKHSHFDDTTPSLLDLVYTITQSLPYDKQPSLYQETYAYAVQEGLFDVALDLIPYLPDHPAMSSGWLEDGVHSLVTDRLDRWHGISEDDAVAFTYALGQIQVM